MGTHEPLADLLDRALGGDHDAREDLIGRYRPLLRTVVNRYARRVYRSRYDESDVVQMTCLDVFRSFDHFAGDSTAEFNRWIEVILERNIYGLRRRHTAGKRDVRRDFASAGSSLDLSLQWLAHDERSPRSRVLAGERALRIADALQSLPAKYREAIEMRFLDGQTLKQIADQMETSVGAVAGYLRRGLNELQQQMPADMRLDGTGGHQ